jgi:hypothetical protein
MPLRFRHQSFHESHPQGFDLFARRTGRGKRPQRALRHDAQGEIIAPPDLIAHVPYSVQLFLAAKICLFDLVKYGWLVSSDSERSVSWKY